MARYINADKMLHELSFYADRPTKRAMAMIKTLPEADVAPVVHSHWIDEYGRFVAVDSDGEVTDSCYCANCKKWLGGSNEYNCSGYYCPKCGAIMDEENTI